MLVDFDPGESGRLISRWLQLFDLQTIKRSTDISSIALREPELLFVSSGALGLYCSMSGESQLTAIVPRGCCISFGGRTISDRRMSVRALKTSNIYIGKTCELRQELPDAVYNQLVLSATTHLFNLFLNQTAAVKVRCLEERIMMVLRNCARFQGQEHNRPCVTLDWGISQVEFANLVGVARPYLNKAIRQLEKAGRLKFDGDTVHLDPEEGTEAA